MPNLFRVAMIDGVKVALTVDTADTGSFFTLPPGPTYGGGTPNTVYMGYQGLLYFGSTLVTPPSVAYSNGNLHVASTVQGLVPAALRAQYPLTVDVNQSHAFVNTVNLIPLSIIAGRVVELHMEYGGASGGVNISAIYLVFDGVNYSLQEAVAAEKIEPLVILASSRNSRYYWPNIRNIYNNTPTGSASYPRGNVAFVTRTALSGMYLNFSSPPASYEYCSVYSWDQRGGFSLTPF